MIIRLAAVINKCRHYFDCLLAHTGQNYGSEYWAGWVLAYYQWLSRHSFAYMKRKGLGANEVVAMYPPLHEADLSKFVDVADGITKK